MAAGRGRLERTASAIEIDVVDVTEAVVIVASSIRVFIIHTFLFAIWSPLYQLVPRRVGLRKKHVSAMIADGVWTTQR